MKRIFNGLMLATALSLQCSIAFATDVFIGSTATEVPSGTADAQAVTGVSRLVGFSCRENAGTPAPAEFIIRNGTNSSAPAVAFVKLAASESVRENLGVGIECPNGVYINRITGTSHVVVYTKQ